MAQPLNQRLWSMLVAQARTKFNEWPSLPASKWVHSEYVKKGGQFGEGKSSAADARHKERAKKRGR